MRSSEAHKDAALNNAYPRVGELKPMEKEDLSRLAQALIELCIQDGDESVTHVSERLTTIQDNLMQAKYEMERLSKVGDTSNNSNHMVVSRIRNSIENMNEAFVSLQFFDRISQRMDHANKFLKAVHDQQEAIEFGQGECTSDALMVLYNGLTMEDERILYRAIEEGESIPVAINKAKTDAEKSNDDDGDIELF